MIKNAFGKQENSSVRSENLSNGVVGHHHEASNVNARVTEYTSPPNQLGVYTGKVEIQNEARQWIEKRSPSTFFPKSWSEARVKYEITEAFKKGDSSKAEAFIEYTPSGIPIKFVPPPKNGEIKQWRGWPLQQTGE